MPHVRFVPGEASARRRSTSGQRCVVTGNDRWVVECENEALDEAGRARRHSHRRRFAGQTLPANRPVAIGLERLALASTNASRSALITSAWVVTCRADPAVQPSACRS